MRFEDVLRLAGLQPKLIVADGRWRRCATESHPKRKNGAYKLALDGQAGWYRDWADGMGVRHWSTDEPNIKPASASDLERQRKHREQERQRRIAGISAARAVWSEGQDFRMHPYLSGKSLSALGCAGLRLWTGSIWHDMPDQGLTKITDTWLMAPMYFRDKLVSVQRISKSGLKLQMKNAPQKGASLVIGKPSAAVTVFCEGLATGLAIFQSMRNVRVVVCFFSGNLVPVAQEMKPRGSVVFAADNDHGTMKKRGFNPGIDAARNAAELVGACIAYPDGILGTDWADYLMENGPQSAKSLERKILAKAKYVTSGV